MRIPTLLLLLAAACRREAPSPPAEVPQAVAPAQAATTPEELTYAADLKVDIPAMRKLPSGLLLQDLAAGQGDSAVAGMTAVVRYTGWLPDGTKFDGNQDGEPYSFRLGTGSVIQGWDLGLVGMKAGGKRKLVIPASLGYGAEGSGPIPPNSFMVFDVELLEIRKQ
jgi:FKBP-type peptidyl-prolyl cis-trans isomerase